MSQIIYYNAITSIDLYRSTLERAISVVKKNVHINDDKIEWIIYNNQSGDETLKKHPDGFYVLGTNQIWISEQTISSYNIMDFMFEDKKSLIPIYFARKRNHLIDVILDELAHITTQKDHGHPLYDRTLREFRAAYYGYYGTTVSKYLNVC